MLALLLFKFPASGKYDAIMNSYVTTTSTMHVRAAKALFYVIMPKVYYLKKVDYAVAMATLKVVDTQLTNQNFGEG